jgi:hypothetical protein
VRVIRTQEPPTLVKSVTARAPLLAALLTSAVAACDPIISLEGRVRSVPPPKGPSAGTAPQPLPGATVSMTCEQTPRLEGKDAGPQYLAITDRDGHFRWVSLGGFSPTCAFEFESGDGTHEPYRIGIKQLCKEHRGNEDCRIIEGIEVDLVRLRPSPPPVALRLKSSPEGLELGADDKKLCTSPCSASLPAGRHVLTISRPPPPHSFRPALASQEIWAQRSDLRTDLDIEVRHESHRGAQEAAGWFMVPMVAGAIVLPIGLAKKDATLLLTGGGLLAGGMIGGAIVWRSDVTDVKIQPLGPALPVASDKP